MKSKSLMIVYIGIVVIVGCNIKKELLNNKTIILNFKKCLLSEKGYNFVQIKIPKGYKKKKMIIHGYCEYRFIYKNNLIFYITTDIYRGSRLNMKNIYNMNYSYITRKTEFSDTIRYKGKTIQGLHWLEYILGDIVVGYINVPTQLKLEFDESLKNIKKMLIYKNKNKNNLGL